MSKRADSLRNQSRLAEDCQEDGEVKRRTPDPMASIGAIRRDQATPEDEEREDEQGLYGRTERSQPLADCYARVQRSEGHTREW